MTSFCVVFTWHPKHIFRRYLALNEIDKSSPGTNSFRKYFIDKGESCRLGTNADVLKWVRCQNSPENLDKLLVAIVVQIFEFKTYFTDPIKLMHFGALLAYKGPIYSEFILKYLSLLTLLESPSRPELPLSIIFIFLKKVRKAEPEWFCFVLNH